MEISLHLNRGSWSQEHRKWNNNLGDFCRLKAFFLLTKTIDTTVSKSNQPFSKFQVQGHVFDSCTACAQLSSVHMRVISFIAIRQTKVSEIRMWFNLNCILKTEQEANAKLSTDLSTVTKFGIDLELIGGCTKVKQMILLRSAFCVFMCLEAQLALKLAWSPSKMSIKSFQWVNDFNSEMTFNWSLNTKSRYGQDRTLTCFSDYKKGTAWKSLESLHRKIKSIIESKVNDIAFLHYLIN